MFSRTCSTRCSNAARSSTSPGGSPSCQDSWSYQTIAPVVSMVRYSQRVGDITSSKFNRDHEITHVFGPKQSDRLASLDHSHGIKFHGFLPGLGLPLIDAASHPESSSHRWRATVDRPRPLTAALVKKTLSSNHHPPPLNCAPATLCQSA